MESQGCADDGSNNYSSPMPTIGLYVAATTLICLLFMLSDMFSGFRNRKTWIPCRHFSLNSITLTLLSIATKLTVDLTTSMPSAYDQLSKLTGSTFLCVSMGFLMPSLGCSGDSECFSNVVAMSILVITIVVNICIQMRTGVISSFRVEHIIILCCLMLLLMFLWVFAPVSNAQKGISVDYIKQHFTNTSSKTSMLQRLKLCYMYSYNTNPQFMICRNLICATVCAFCLLCSTVLMQATFRSLFSKSLDFCNGVSDYKWSMKYIVITQIVTTLVGTLGTIFRLITMAGHVQVDDPRVIGKEVKNADSVILFNPVLHHGYKGLCVAIVMGLTGAVVSLAEILVVIPYAIMAQLIQDFSTKARESDSEGGDHKVASSAVCDDETMKDFKDLIHEGEMGLDAWTLKKATNDMKAWIELNTGKTTKHLMELLSKTPPSQESLTLLVKDHYDSTRPGYEISSLSIVLIAKIAALFLPAIQRESLTSSLDEVFEIIHFIDKKTCAPSFENKKKSKLTKALWRSREDFSIFVPKIVDETRIEAFLTQSKLEQVIEVVGGLKQALPSDFVWEELGLITDFIKQQVYGSLEEVYGFLEQVFVDMVIEFLVQLPNAITKEIVESQPEDLEESVKNAVKFICKIEPLDAIVQWAFPVGTNITNLIADDQHQDPNDQNRISSVESTDVNATTNAPNLLVNGESCRSSVSGDTHQDEIIEIE